MNCKQQLRALLKFRNWYLLLLFYGSSTSVFSQSEQFNHESAVQTDSIHGGFTEHIPPTKIAFDMVLIPEGSFLMGSPDDEPNRKADEGPRRQVRLDSFYMAKYELTWEIFELFFKQNKALFVKLDSEKVIQIDAISRPSAPYEDPSYGMGKEGCPAVSMSTYAALVFCKWLSSITGRFYRLPTEAEWEFAARAGSTAPYGFENPDALTDYAVYRKNAKGKYAAVGTKKPNAWGLYDMLGNVAEWTIDEYQADAYLKVAESNPWVVPTVIHPRVFRGGSWDDDAVDLRLAARAASTKKLQKRDPQIPKSFWWFTDSNFVGFRLVSPAKQPSIDKQKEFWRIVLDE